MESADKEPDCSFVICVEAGSLEYKALLLILTLRKNWGNWSRLPVYAYSPRKDRKPSDWLRAIYELYQIRPVYEDLNINFADYPLANKPIAMAHAERTLDSETLVFLDTDVLCWNPPTHFELAAGADLSLCVDGTKTVASRGLGDRYEPMWQTLYRLAGVTQEPPYVVTHLTSERVRGWWMSSIIPSRRRAGIMGQWLDLFQKVAREDFFVPEAAYMREQMTLDAVAARLAGRFAELPITHNYPVQNHDYYSRKGISPESAVLWHYQQFLNRFFRDLSQRVDAAPTVDAKLAVAESAVEKLRVHFGSLIGFDESLLHKWRRQLQLGPRIRRVLGRAKPSDSHVLERF